MAACKVKKSNANVRMYEDVFKYDPTEESVKLMQMLSYFCTANIIKKRDILPISTFRKHVVEDVSFYSINRNDVVGQTLVDKLKGLADAILDTYIEEFHIVLSEDLDNSDNAVEAYTFKFTYIPEAVMQITSSAGVISEVNFKDSASTRMDLLDIMRKLNTLLSIMPDVVEGTYASFRLSFTQWTPQDYWPSFWNPSKTLFHFPTNPKEVHCGNVSGAKAGLALSAQSIYIDDNLIYQFLNYCKKELEQNCRGTMEVNMPQLERTLTGDSTLSLSKHIHQKPRMKSVFMEKRPNRTCKKTHRLDKKTPISTRAHSPSN